MPVKTVECVPNFSEGRDRAKIKAITDAIEAVPEVKLLDVDLGPDANRTVVTFVGPPEAVAEAAFQAIAKAAQVIDMREHQGTHPRLGATDVCPFVPVAGVTLEDCAEIARRVGRQVGDELGISVYFYEAAAGPRRKNLADVRRGEYEGLAEKLEDPRWKPDCGPASFNPHRGATIIGAREFLIAYNITLDTPDASAATDIALELREKGRVARAPNASPFYSKGEVLLYKEGHYPCGNCEFIGKTLQETQRHCQTVHGYNLRSFLAETATDDPNVIGQKVRRAGMFKSCKAIGWYAKSYGRAQISMNLTNFHMTPPHLVLERARELAAQRGLVVTGSEVVGLIPYAALLDAGRYYLIRQGRSPCVPAIEVLETAVSSMGLSDVRPFDIHKKVIGLPEGAASGTF
jgi:glutamate formiminotransferase/formiminotetrahydrofolate cyclodeaminase